MMFAKKGFTMVELLVVLLIIGILVAVAAPMYFANTNRARVSEAMAGMGTIRQAERDTFLSKARYFNILVGNINNALPSSINAMSNPTPANAGVGLNAGVAQYFSNASYSVIAGTIDDNGTPANPLDDTFTNPTWQGGLTNATAGPPGAPVNFVVYALGNASVACVADSTDCAVKANEVSNFSLQMDNSGRAFVSYDAGVSWSAY